MMKKRLQDIIKISSMFDKQIRQEKKEFQHVIQPQEMPLSGILISPLDYDPKKFHSFTHFVGTLLLGCCEEWKNVKGDEM